MKDEGGSIAGGISEGVPSLFRYMPPHLSIFCVKIAPCLDNVPAKVENSFTPKKAELLFKMGLKSPNLSVRGRVTGTARRS